MERSSNCSTSSLYGAAFLAGIIGGKKWNNIEDLGKFRKNVEFFKPDSLNESSGNFYNKNDCMEWNQALQLYAEWHQGK